MRKMSAFMILTVFYALMLLIDSSYLSAGNNASIIGVWKNSIGGQIQTIEISAKDIKETITGAGMPAEGVVMVKKIASIVPGQNNGSGIIVTGPADNLMKPYEAFHWFNLGKKDVKFYIGGGQFDTVKEAGKSKGELKYARVFERVK